MGCNYCKESNKDYNETESLLIQIKNKLVNNKLTITEYFNLISNITKTKTIGSNILEDIENYSSDSNNSIINNAETDSPSKDKLNEKLNSELSGNSNNSEHENNKDLNINNSNNMRKRHINKSNNNNIDLTFEDHENRNIDDNSILDLIRSCFSTGKEAIGILKYVFPNFNSSDNNNDYDNKENNIRNNKALFDYFSINFHKNNNCYNQYNNYIKKNKSNLNNNKNINNKNDNDFDIDLDDYLSKKDKENFSSLIFTYSLISESSINNNDNNKGGLLYDNFFKDILNNIIFDNPDNDSIKYDKNVESINNIIVTSKLSTKLKIVNSNSNIFDINNKRSNETSNKNSNTNLDSYNNSPMELNSKLKVFLAVNNLDSNRNYDDTEDLSIAKSKSLNILEHLNNKNAIGEINSNNNSSLFNSPKINKKNANSNESLDNRNKPLLLSSPKRKKSNSKQYISNLIQSNKEIKSNNSKSILKRKSASEIKSGNNSIQYKDDMKKQSLNNDLINKINVNSLSNRKNKSDLKARNSKFNDNEKNKEHNKRHNDITRKCSCGSEGSPFSSKNIHTDYKNKEEELDTKRVFLIKPKDKYRKRKEKYSSSSNKTKYNEDNISPNKLVNAVLMRNSKTLVNPNKKNNNYKDDIKEIFNKRRQSKLATGISKASSTTTSGKYNTFKNYYAIYNAIIKQFFWFYCEININKIFTKILDVVVYKLEAARMLRKKQGTKSLVLLNDIDVEFSYIDVLKEHIRNSFSIKKVILLYEKIMSEFYISLKQSNKNDYKAAFNSINEFLYLENIIIWCCRCPDTDSKTR